MDSLDTRKDSELLKRAQAGDLAAFEALYKRYHLRIYRVLYGVVGNGADAADLTQEAFVRAYSELDRIRSDGNLYGWLRKTALNLGIDCLRRKKTLTLVSLDAPRESSDGDAFAWEVEDEAQNLHRALEAQSLHEALHVGIERLSPDHRTVVTMHYIEEMPVEEIAELLDVPVGTVKSRLARARDALRQMLTVFFD